jgi:hypothetical protein
VNDWSVLRRSGEPHELANNARNGAPSTFISGMWATRHVDNLGAYSIPSETGLLIPCDFDSLGSQCTDVSRLGIRLKDEGRAI